MTATFLHGLELGFAIGAATVAIAIAPRLRMLRFEGLSFQDLLEARRKAGAR